MKDSIALEGKDTYIIEPWRGQKNDLPLIFKKGDLKLYEAKKNERS